MSATYDVETDVGLLRLCLQDTDTDNAAFSDEELNALLAQTSNDIYMAASLGWTMVAGHKAKLAKKKSAGKFSYDTTGAANYCLQQSEKYKKLSEDTPVFDYAEWGTTDFARRQIMLNAQLREGQSWKEGIAR